jgi:hypothetical protein
MHCKQPLQVSLSKSGGNEQSPFFDDESVVVDAETVPVTPERFHVLVDVDLSFWQTSFDDDIFSCSYSWSW